MHGTEHASLVLEHEVALSRTDKDERLALRHTSGREDGFQQLDTRRDALVVVCRQVATLPRILGAREERAREAVAEVPEVGVANGH
jgi:hypothetical protein